jgi:hypothetical protein
MDFPFAFWLRILTPYEFWTLWEGEAILNGWEYSKL